MGYNGSVGVSLGRILCNKYYIDKLYLWESEKNQKVDAENGTRTFCMLGMNDIPFWDFLFECLLRPFEGSCTGFVCRDGEVVPVLEECTINAETHKAVDAIQSDVLQITESFADVFAGVFLQPTQLDYFPKILKEVFFNGFFFKSMRAIQGISLNDDGVNRKMTNLITGANQARVLAAKEHNFLNVFKFWFWRIIFKIDSMIEKE